MIKTKPTTLVWLLSVFSFGVQQGGRERLVGKISGKGPPHLRFSGSGFLDISELVSGIASPVACECEPSNVF